MPKRPQKPSSPADWINQLDPIAIDAAAEDATIDAHDLDEQYSGFMTVMEDELVFPFSAKVMGEVLSVVGMEWPENDGFGMDLVIERNGEQHRIDARSVELIEPFPNGHLVLAAYLKWRRFA